MKYGLFSIVLAVALLTLSGCNPKSTTTEPQPTPTNDENQVSTTVKAGDTVKVDYVGTLDDGTVFDTSLVEKAREAGLFDENRPYEPLVVNVGNGEVIPGFDNALVGMKVGESKTVTIPAAEAYGDPRTELVQPIPMDSFTEAGVTPTVGEIYNFGIAQGEIKEVGETEVTIDFNHPLAGKNLTFVITVKEILPPEVAPAVAPTEQPTNN